MAYLSHFTKSLATMTCALGFAALLGSCSEDFNDRVVCATADDCGFPTDMTERECCGGFCMAALPGGGTGCDSGYRYITSEPGFGDCVVAPMCVIEPDLSVVPVDMAKHD